jgi:hypothetical protein
MRQRRNCDETGDIDLVCRKDGLCSNRSNQSRTIDAA